MKDRYVAAIDQGTARSRCMVFDRDGRIVVGRPEGAPAASIPQARLGRARRRGDLAQRPEVVRRGARPGRPRRRPTSPRSASPTSARRPCSGTATPAAGPQRDRLAGHPHRPSSCASSPATPGTTASATATGLPLATYFSGPKMRWLLDNVAGAARAGRGRRGAVRHDRHLADLEATGRHVTDVTNASRTMLMNLQHARLGRRAARRVGVPRAMLPEIRPSTEIYGEARGPLGGVPVAGVAGRPAGRAVRPDLLRARRGQEHLRHRLLPADEHRRPSRCASSTAC